MNKNLQTELKLSFTAKNLQSEKSSWRIPPLTKNNTYTLYNSNSTDVLPVITYMFVEHLPESPTNAQPQAILQIQPIMRKTIVASCITPTKQLTHRMEVRLMSGRSPRVRKKAIRPDATVPVWNTNSPVRTFMSDSCSVMKAVREGERRFRLNERLRDEPRPFLFR